MSGWTEPRAELSAEEKILEQLSALSPRDHAIAVACMTLMGAFRDAGKIDASHFKDLAFAICKSVSYTTDIGTLQFLKKQLAKAPAQTTVADVVVVLNMMGLRSIEAADNALRDVQRLVALLPSESGNGAPDASK